MIRVDKLSFAYPGVKKPTIKDMSFEVQDGEIFGFLGPSGAGKSTTQNILISILKGWQGSIEVLGRDLKSWDSSYYQTIGVCFELPNHYLKLTARENLEYFRALYSHQALSVEEALDLVGLLEHADKAAADFSKGMKNRLNFARSLLHRPKLWFLDEPTSGLDPVNALKIRNLVKKKQSEGVTTLITTHDMHTAQTLCDRVAFIVDGTIKIIDSPDNLRAQFGKRAVEVRWQEDAQDGLSSESFGFDGLARNQGFLKALSHPELVSVHSQESSLEDVFVEVTGRSLQ